MGWQTVNAVVVHAGNTIINPNGVFTYSGAPALGNLIFSSAPAAGTDRFGNAYVQGAAAYVTNAGTTFALELGTQTASGTAFFIHNLTSPPNADPAFSGSGSPAGSLAQIQSGKGTAGAAQSIINVEDSLQSGVAGGQIQLLAGSVLLDNLAAVPIPQTRPTITSLPIDNNSGSTWVSGERLFMNNNWVANVNANFSNIVNSLVNLGIWS